MVKKRLSCMKYLLFAFNLLFLILGCALIGLGAYVKVSMKSVSGTVAVGPAIAIVVAGVITVAVAFFGCCGSIKENRCMLITFSLLIGLLLIIEISTGITGFVYRNKAKELFEGVLNITFDDYQKNNTYAKNTWDFLQKQLECCGLHSKLDYGNSALPNSCCRSGTTCTSETAFKDDCLDEIEDFIKGGLGKVAGIAIGISIVEIIGIVLACFLARALTEYEAQP